MQSTEPIRIPDRTIAAAARTPTVLHTDEDGEFLVLRDDGTHGRLTPGRILEAEGLAGSFWARITSKRDYRVGAMAGGVAAVVGVRFEPLTAEEAEEALARQIAERLARDANRPRVGTQLVKPDRRSQAEREAAGDDSPPDPPASRGPRSRPIGTQREPASSSSTTRQVPLARPAGIGDQTGRVAGPASSASTPPEAPQHGWR